MMRAGPSRSRGGSALVECLVALAVAAAVFLPALAVLRSALRADRSTAVRAEAAAEVRPAARAAATRLRLGAEAAGSAATVADVRASDAEPLPGGKAPQAVSAVADGCSSGFAVPPPLPADGPR